MASAIAPAEQEAARQRVEQDGNSAPAQALPGVEQIRGQLGPNNEKLNEVRPDLVSELKQLMLEYRVEGLVARRHEIRRIRQARLFWQGLQYAWFSPQDMNWHLPWEAKIYDDNAMQEGPRYQFVTNLYQGFGLMFIAVFTGDTPEVEFYPESTLDPNDVATAKEASSVAALIERNNCIEALKRRIGWLLWTDGKIGAYVRYVADGNRFGWKEMQELAQGQVDAGDGTMIPAITAAATRKVPNGQETISIIDGLQLNTPVWADEMIEMPWLQWQIETHIAKLKSAFPHVRDKIEIGGPIQGDDIYARSARIALKQGMPTTHPGDALYNLITFSRTWIRPWAFESIENEQRRKDLQALFPNGCYVAFAGETYCESRDESMDDFWRVMHALPGDGQNKPSAGDSTISVQERYNTLSNIQMESAEYGIPPIYADPQVLDFDALANQTAEPAAHYPARARPGMALGDGFFQPAATQMSPDAMKHMEDLLGAIPQFLSGLMPSIFGGEVPDLKTMGGFAMARDQAMGRIGLVWRAYSEWYAEVMLLGVNCFRRNRVDDVEVPSKGKAGDYESKFLRLANLQGKIHAHPEADAAFPRLKSQQRAALDRVMNMPDPEVAKILAEPANAGFVKSLSGLTELVVPGEDSATKQQLEIQQLLQGAPQAQPGADGVTPILISTVPVDALLDRHAEEFEECVRWASSQAGIEARQQNPAGFANVRAHAQQHQQALAAKQAPQQKPPSESINFKDLPPDGQAQMAGQAGIRLNPLALAAKQEQDKADKAAELRARLKGRGGEPVQA
jgi:hypothetical protein